ncbi:MAG: DUF5998 family protein [Nocardioidaceae bacterium]
MFDRSSLSTGSQAAADGVDRTASMRSAIEATGYYPAVVSDAVLSALAEESVLSFVLQHEPTFDRDEVRRHVTVVALTTTRLIVAHTDEHPPDDLLPSPYTSSTTEAIRLSSVKSVVVNKMVADPTSYATKPLPPDTAAEAVVTIGWGAVGRIDLEPATCGDPECDGDHGYAGTMTADDFSLRMSATADGEDAVRRLLSFARDLSSATTPRE